MVNIYKDRIINTQIKVKKKNYTSDLIPIFGINIEENDVYMVVFKLILKEKKILLLKVIVIYKMIVLIKKD